jgi:mannose/fructose/N-acetylgalactosamine-specific phosphotransferase system component IIB
MDFIMRIDDRFIHGQVTAGWVRPLGIERIILANDAVAGDEWEREIYTLAVPPEIEVKIVNIIDATEFIKNNQDHKKTMVLLNTLKDALTIIESGVKITKLNIGGLHYENGKKSYATYIFLSDEDIYYAKKIIEYGVILEGREIPGSPSTIIDNLIKEAT